MAKKKENGNELELVKNVPERFQKVLGEKELYHLKAEANQSQEPSIDGYTYYGTGDHGFYYVKS